VLGRAGRLVRQDWSGKLIRKGGRKVSLWAAPFIHGSERMGRKLIADLLGTWRFNPTAYS
jgi:hypothetical protein